MFMSKKQMSFRINRQLANVEIHLNEDFGPVGQISQVIFFLYIIQSI